jgi:hypothetical protein
MAEASSWSSCATAFRALHCMLAAAQTARGASTGGAAGGACTGGASAGGVLSASGAGPALPQRDDNVRFLKPAGDDSAGGATHEPWGGGAFPLWHTSDPACMLTVMLLVGFTESAVAGQRRALPVGVQIVRPQRELAQRLTLGLPLCTPGDVDAWASKMAALSPPAMSAAALADVRARLLACPGRNDVDDTLHDWVDGASALLPFSPQLSHQRLPPWMAAAPRGEWVPAPAASGLPNGTPVLVVDIGRNKQPDDTAAAGALAAACPVAGAPAGQQQQLLYHGTTWLGAQSLLGQGISLNVLFIQRSLLDFGTGFYMTPDFAVARKYACAYYGAVVVIARAPHLERPLSMTHPHDAPLPPPPLSLEGGEGLCEWQQLVGAHYRGHRAAAAAIVGTSAVLTGPISANPDAVSRMPPPGAAPLPCADGGQMVAALTQQAAMSLRAAWWAWCFCSCATRTPRRGSCSRHARPGVGRVVVTLAHMCGFVCVLLLRTPTVKVPRTPTPPNCPAAPPYH